MRSYIECSDQELIVLLKNGDRLAFAEIYDRYWTSMYAHVFKMLRDRDDTLDVLQDLFSSIWLKSDTISPDTNLAGFLYISVRNRVFNLIKHHKVKNDYLDAVAQFMNDSTDETVETLEERDLTEAIENEIQKLPPRVREVFELSRKKHLSHKEIAQLLNISDQTVRKQIQHALRVLRPKVSAMGATLSVLLL